VNGWIYFITARPVIRQICVSGRLEFYKTRESTPTGADRFRPLEMTAGYQKKGSAGIIRQTFLLS
jgi:hypothetical protein